jgi:ubiquinol-cytochrome c reductase iron-sulfur subunit
VALRAREGGGRPVEVDISRMEPGDLKVVEWRGKPVWVIRARRKCSIR